MDCCSRFHYLIVPKRHIKDVKSLVKSDSELLEEMVKIAHSVLDSNGADKSDTRYFRFLHLFCVY